MSDNVIMFNSAIGLCGTIFTGVMVYFMARLKNQADKAAIEVKNVAANLTETSAKTESKLNNIAKVTDATHKLSNSMMGVQLRLYSVATQKIADLTRGNPGAENDQLIADEALRQFQEHERQQAQVDAAHPEGIKESAT